MIFRNPILDADDAEWPGGFGAVRWIQRPGRGGRTKKEMKVWVYPERTFEELGAVRYQLSWEELKPAAVGKEEYDPDTDVLYRIENFQDEQAAIRRGHE
jgi:hypothetical protein